MNILFINSNLYGHINPTLGLIKKLIDNGNTVDYFCSESFSGLIEDTGAKCIGFSEKLNEFLSKYKPTDRHPFFMLMEYMLLYDEAMIPEILDIVKKTDYDMLICDSIFGGACFLRQLTKAPIVCSHSSFAMSEAPVPKRMLEAGFHSQLDNCYKILARICQSYKIKEPSLEQVFTSKGDLNLVYTTRSFNKDDKLCQSDYLFLGPTVNRKSEIMDWDFSVIGNRKLIYISLGSMNTNFVDFYKMCISAFKDTNYYVCMSVGNKISPSQLGEFPSNFLIREFFPQLEVLKHTDIFITHAGFNSVNEALYFGVPMLALPQVNDQFKVAKRIVDMDLGVSENIKELSPEKLLHTANSLISNNDIKNNCVKMSQEMRNVSDSEAIEKLKKIADEWEGRI